MDDSELRQLWTALPPVHITAHLTAEQAIALVATQYGIHPGQPICSSERPYKPPYTRS